MLIRKRFILLGALLVVASLAVDPLATVGAIEGALPAFSKFFNPPTIATGNTSLLIFVINNNANGTDATGIDFIDSLPGGLALTGPGFTTCTGGTLTAVAGTGTVSYTGGSVGAGSSCNVQVFVTSSTAGTYVNTTGDLTSSFGNSGPTTDTLTVLELGFTKTFTDDPVAAGGIVTLEFTITNPFGFTVNNLTFTDDLDAALAGLTAVGLPAMNICGAGSMLSGTSLLTFAGGSLPALSSCTFSATLQVPAGASSGSFLNTTSGLTGSSSTTGPPASDSLDVEPPPGFAKSFSPSSIGQDGTSTLTFTIDNTASSLAADSLDFTDSLPIGIVVANPSNPATTCTGGTVTAAPGSGAITYNGGGSAGAGATCTVTVDVTSSTAGAHVNTTGSLTSSLGDSGTATDTLTVTLMPLFAKSFAPTTIASGATSTLTFTVDNSANATAANNLDFTDNLPAGVVVATPTNAATTCTGGTITAAAGSGAITYNGGGSAGAGATCTVTVDVTSSTAGFHSNTTGSLTSSLGDSGTASDTLTVTLSTFSVSSATGSGTINGDITDTGGTCSITSATPTTAAAVAGSGPPGVSFPHGLIDFLIEFCSPGDTVTFTITYPSPLPAGAEYWKYGPTPTDGTPHWYTIPAVIAGNTAVFDITDGGLGDDDLTPNGTVDDPGGPGAAAAVPAMPTWALAILALLLLAASGWAMRPRHVNGALL